MKSAAEILCEDGLLQCIICVQLYLYLDAEQATGKK